MPGSARRRCKLANVPESSGRTDGAGSTDRSPPGGRLNRPPLDGPAKPRRAGQTPYHVRISTVDHMGIEIRWASSRPQAGTPTNGSPVSENEPATGPPGGSVGNGTRAGRAQPGISRRRPRGLQMSRDGHGFELPVDPRIRARQAAAETQRAFNAGADQVASKSAHARAERDRLAPDRDVERALTATRRARG